MSVEEFPTSLRRYFSHNVVCFPATLHLLAVNTSLFRLFCFIQNQGIIYEELYARTKKTQMPHCVHPLKYLIKAKVFSKLAIQSTDYHVAFTQSR